MLYLDTPITLLLFSFLWCSLTEAVTVQISDGEIVGSQFVSSWTNKTVYAFLGIPYASPPVGDLRFKPPVPPVKWSDAKDCTRFGAGCMQVILEMPSAPRAKMSQIMPGTSEDCLFLNVYSPELKPTGALAPVYVWIHGGGFIIGMGSSMGPDPLVAEGVVVVTLNYRLGAFGFLTLGTSDVPGNAALFDQVLALKWVQKEISKFGGDPNRVTIGGQSAGSMMVHLHYLSPVSQGLFHAAIAESGASLAIIAIDGAPDLGLQLAELVNCSTADITFTQQCLRNLSADVIVNAQSLVPLSVIDNVCLFISPWVPTVDKDTNKDNPFLPVTPAELIAQGQGSAVPLLFGTNRDEGTMFYILGGADQRLNTMDNNTRYLIPSEVLAVSSSSSIQEKEKEIKAKYFGGKEPSASNMLGYIKFIGDYIFDYPTAKSAQAFHNRSAVFLYRFEFDGSFRPTFEEEIDKEYQTCFVGHRDEMTYLYLVPFSSNQSNADPDSKEMITFNRMVRLWTNFIKYKTPTLSPDSLLQNLSWTPVQNNSLHYLEITENLTMVHSDYEAQVVQFWDNINSMPSSSTTLFISVYLLSLLALHL